MAFVGHMRHPEKLFDNEVFEKSSSKIHLNYQKAEDMQRAQLEANCSGTYIKTYDLPSPVDRSGRRRARYVDNSESCGDFISMAETEMSTLRCSSIRSNETETETLVLSQSSSENKSDDSSTSTSDMPENVDPVQYEHRKQRGSTTSMCSWEDQQSLSTYELRRPTDMEVDVQSSSVPYLELGSDAPSNGQLQRVKLMRESNEAYENWLSGKRRQLQYRQQAVRKQRELQQEKDELRRQLNDQRVREWCAQKRAQEALNSISNFKASMQKNLQHTQLDMSARRSLQEWELKKIQQAQRQREVQQVQARRKQHQQLQRKEQAARAWQNWMKGVDQRPKPVPSNQGMKSLRGTISKLYINPKHWEHINGKTASH